jgi:hypothetical protein
MKTKTLLFIFLLIGIALSRKCTYLDDPPIAGNDPCEIPEGDIVIVTPPED